MFVLAPILGDDGRILAALGFRMPPERTFTRVLNVARFGRYTPPRCESRRMTRSVTSLSWAR